jgi:ABC-type branched-subunit amino acid transport system substrate-binding protein
MMVMFAGALLLSSFNATADAASGSGSSSPGLGVGVSAHTVKVGVALVNFTCIEQFQNTIRLNQSQVYNAFIKYINAHGGIAGRKVVPDYQSYCPIQNAQALTLCTQFTEDAKVFAVIGDFIDFSGDAQTCIAKDHKTVLLTFDLTQAILNQSPPGLIILPGTTAEREDSVLISLLKSEHTLKGKKIAVLGEQDSQNVVNSSVVPGLKKLGVPLGSTAILDVTGADTSAAQSQLDSFIEKWKSENVTALYVTGTQVASQQFIEKVRQEMPKVTLLTDDTASDILGYGQQEQRAGKKPNPYQGIITAGGQTPQEYDASSNWKHCAAIYKQETGKKAPNAVAIIPGPNGKTLDTYGSINDACQLLSMLQEIGNRVGKNLNDKNWVSTVNHYGKIIDYGAGQYASLHTGKYDDNDTFRLEEYSSTLGPQGDWKPITPLVDVPGS